MNILTPTDPEARRTPQVLPGARWRRHTASVQAILGADCPPVESHGDRFYNVDRWVGGKFLITELGKVETPWTEDLFREAIARANGLPAPHRKIVVAETPDNLPLRTLEALIGGCYHEAFHTRYSHRHAIEKAEEAWLIENLYPLLPKIPVEPRTWSLLANLWNLIEDIRIERLGCVEYPGVPDNMAALMDFVLEQGDKERQKHNLPIQPMGALFESFQILGFEYDTPRCQACLVENRQAYPDLCAMLESGPLADILQETKSLREQDLLHPLVLAVRLLLAILDAGQNPYPKDEAPKGLRIIIRNLQDILQGKKPELVDQDGNPIHLEDFPDLGFLSSDEALGQAIREAWQARDLAPGEDPWHPYSTAHDQLHFIQPLRNNSVKADLIRLRRQSNTLRLRLSTLFKMRQQTFEVHGLPEGEELSEDYLVQSYTELQHGIRPTTPWKSVSDRMELSIDAVTVLDQSGSMSSSVHILKDTSLMLNDALTGLRAKTFILGFVSGDKDFQVEDVMGNYHRRDSTDFHIYKTWEQPWEKAQQALNNIEISGSTPMSDGIQLGLSLLRKRTSRFRFLFVVTDGQPDPNHQKVVTRQLRLAEEAGYFAVGIGIGSGAAYVKTLFPHHVWVEDLNDLAQACAFKLAQLLEPHVTLWDTSVFNYSLGSRKI